MNTEQIEAARQCASLSAAGTIHFGEVVARLQAAGVERYHADYTRRETTYYTPEGGSCVVPMAHETHETHETHEPAPIAPAFSAEGVRAAVGRAQRGEVMYPQFTRLALAAGCVGYLVQIAGQRVQYLGRRGEVHTEWFPGAGPDA